MLDSSKLRLFILVECITYYFSSSGLDKAELSFSSQAQYLAVNEASVSWLIDKISDDLDFKKDTAVHRFRGNIIVEGCKAFDEMQWKHVRIGNNNFKVNCFFDHAIDLKYIAIKLFNDR